MSASSSNFLSNYFGQFGKVAGDMSGGLVKPLIEQGQAQQKAARRGEIEQERAQKSAIARVQSQQELSQQEINKANQKAPDIGALLLAATKKKRSATDLTGGTLGETSLLGDVGEAAQ